MSLPTAYTVTTLNSDALALSKAIEDALTKADSVDVRQAWIDVAVSSANITSGLAYLAANDPKWAGVVGTISTLTSIGTAADRISDALQTSGDINTLKAGDILAVVGGLSDIAGNLLVKPGPPLVAGLTLKGAGLLAGVAQNVVGDQTIGQLMLITTANQAPLVATELFEHAPDGIPLNTLITRQVGNHQIDVYWTKDAQGNYIKNESISSRTSDGTLTATNFTQYQHDNLGKPVGAISWLYDGNGVLKNIEFLVPTADGKAWSGPLDTVITVIKKLFNQAGQAASPLILDLDGDGVETLGMGEGIHFDHDANKFRELSGWAGKDDGLLVWDRNDNGQIDSGLELFGNNTLLANGQKAANGFDALAGLDANVDGKIDALDEAFTALRVWKDADSDGLVDDGELLSLVQAGVESINTGFTNQSLTDNDILNGSYTGDTYLYARGDGQDTVNEIYGSPGNDDKLMFADGISADQIWFRQSGFNLEVSVIGTTDMITVSNWFLGNSFHVEQFKSGDGKVLLDSQVDNLVQAMATFAPPAAGQTSMSASYQASLAPVLAANWQ